MSANGPAAAQTLLAFGTWRKGYCLEAVWAAFKRNGARTDRNAGTALVGWEKSDGKHHGDRNPPPGVPVWFGAKAGNNAGDVVISLGGGLVAATDWPRNGVIGVTTIDARQRQIGRPYLGWTETILGAPITYGTPAPVPTGTPKPTPPTPRRRNRIMLEATYRTPSNTLAGQSRLGGAITFFDDADEWTAIAMASGMSAWQVSDAKLEQLAARYGKVPAGLYDDGRQPLFILAPDDPNDSSRYGALGNRAWPLTDTVALAALQKAGATVRIIPQREIDAALAWRTI